ncbi:TPA: glycosyltransferase family 2 protein [Enterobacter chengduensis]
MISILTPTYNRAYTLKRLYISLLNQVTKDFEWIVIDDGSEDDTQALIESFQQENIINIFYHKQLNLGKPQAINTGVKLCNSEYVFIVDSDDALTTDAITSITDSLQQVETENKAISGVAFRRAYFNGDVIGDNLDSAVTTDVCYLRATEAGHLFAGDLAYCFKREMLLKFPFPSYENEKFVPELFIWNKITDCALIKYHKVKAIYLSEYLDDGLSKNFSAQLKANPKGFGLYYLDQLKREVSFFKKAKMLMRYIQCRLYEIKK